MSESNNPDDTGPPPLPDFDPTNVQTYPASCHCGVISYTVTLSPPVSEWKVVSCNCTICQRNGYYLVYPSREQVHLNSGEKDLKSYSFGPKKNLHKFCGQCGSSVFFDPRMKEFGEGGGLDLLGINVRMFHGVNLDELDIVHIDNRAKDKTSARSDGKDQGTL